MQTNTIALPVGELRPALTGLGKLIPKSPNLPVLACVRISRDPDGWVHLTGTDLDSFVSVRLEQPCHGDPVSSLVPLAELNKIIKTQPNGDNIELVLGEEGASLRYPVGRQHVSVKLEDIAENEFPSQPILSGAEIPFPEPVRSSLLEAMQCVSCDQTRYVLNGVYLDVSAKSGHYVVGTNGRHLYSANSFHLPLPGPVIVPDRKFLQWKPFQADGQWTLTLSEPEKPDTPPVWLRIASRRWSLITRCIEGNYPNYKQVIPQSDAFNTSVDLGPEGAATMLDVIRRLPGAEKTDKPVQLHMIDGGLSIAGRNADESEPERVRIEGVTTKGKPVIIALNRDYLAKAMRFGLTKAEFIDGQSPIRFSNEGRQIIAMPMRIAVTDVASQTPAPVEPQPERNPMPQTTPHTNGAPRSTTPTTPATTSDKPAIEAAVEKLEVLRSTLRETLTTINEASGLLKQAMRDQRSEAKEIQSVRQTLRTLQSVKF